jgi:hypothetical protein
MLRPEEQNELEKIYERDGALNPETIIATARAATSPLHDRFEWDDGVAAHQHRLNQARRLIRVWVTVVPQASKEPVHAFVSISSLRGSEGGSYKATADIISNAELYEMAKSDAFKALERLHLSYNYIRELDQVWKALAKALAAARLKEAA